MTNPDDPYGLRGPTGDDGLSEAEREARAQQRIKAEREQVRGYRSLIEASLADAQDDEDES